MSNKIKITATVDTDLLKKAKDKTGIVDNDALFQEGIRELLRTQIRRNTLSMKGMGWGWDDESDLERKTTPNEQEYTGVYEQLITITNSFLRLIAISRWRSRC